MTQRIELIKWLIDVNLFLWLIELNLFLRTTFQFDSKCWTLQITQRIELFFLNITPRIEPFSLNITQRIDPFFWIWRKELNSLWTCLERIEPLFEYDSKNWISFWVWQKNRTFFLNTTQWIEPIFLNVTQKNWNFGWKNCQKIQNVFLHDSKNPTRFFQYDSKNWTFFDLTQRFNLFSLTPRIELLFE